MYIDFGLPLSDASGKLNRPRGERELSCTVPSPDFGGSLLGVARRRSVFLTPFCQTPPRQSYMIPKARQVTWSTEAL